jgi:hypothetical protein
MLGPLVGGAAGGPDMMSLLNNPALMNMVCDLYLKISVKFS